MTPATQFHSAIRAAQIWLMGGALPQALRCLRRALTHANRISPAARRMVLRVMNWVRADILRAAA